MNGSTRSSHMVWFAHPGMTKHPPASWPPQLHCRFLGLSAICSQGAAPRRAAACGGAGDDGPQPTSSSLFFRADAIRPLMAPRHERRLPLMHRIALALVAACLASPTLAEPVEKPQQEVRLDLDGDGKLDLARIVEPGRGEAELHIYLGIGDATPDAARKADIVKKEIARNVIIGLAAGRGRSLVVTDSCGGCTQSPLQGSRSSIAAAGSSSLDSTSTGSSGTIPAAAASISSPVAARDRSRGTAARDRSAGNSRRCPWRNGTSTTGKATACPRLEGMARPSKRMASGARD